MRIRNGFDSLFWSGLKTGAENYIFWCEIRSGFGRHTPRKNSWQYPPPPPGDTQSTLSQQMPSENGYLKMVPAFLQSVPLTTL